MKKKNKVFSSNNFLLIFEINSTNVKKHNFFVII